MVMKIIGVDFGSKRVGIETADTETKMAFPKSVLINKDGFFDMFSKICIEENIELVVLGESKNFQMENNAIMKEINEFKDRVEKELSLKVEMQSEFMTSEQARREQGENDMLDASAATIILQSYLDKIK